MARKVINWTFWVWTAFILWFGYRVVNQLLPQTDEVALSSAVVGVLVAWLLGAMVLGVARHFTKV